MSWAHLPLAPHRGIHPGRRFTEQGRTASHVEEGGAFVLLAPIIAEQLLFAELPRRRRAMPLAGVGTGRVAGAEVTEGVCVLGETDEGVQLAVEVRAASERQRPLAQLFPHEVRRLRVQGEGGGDRIKQKFHLNIYNFMPQNNKHYLGMSKTIRRLDRFQNHFQ